MHSLGLAVPWISRLLRDFGSSRARSSIGVTSYLYSFRPTVYLQETAAAATQPQGIHAPTKPLNSEQQPFQWDRRASLLNSSCSQNISNVTSSNTRCPNIEARIGLLQRTAFKVQNWCHAAPCPRISNSSSVFIPR